MQIIRFILGRIILLVNFLTPPRGVKRSAAEQAVVDAETKSLDLKGQSPLTQSLQPTTI